MTALSSCAGQQASSEPVAASQPSQALGRFQEIDPRRPPMSGLWLTWDDAYAVVVELETERRQHKIEMIQAQTEAKVANDQLHAVATQSFFREWGFPLGLGIGSVTTGLIIGLVSGLVHK